MKPDLLERAIAYLLAVLPEAGHDPNRPTPCRGWDLGMLLSHIDESICALRAGLTDGRVCLEPPEPKSTGVAAIRAGATGLLGDWANAHPERVLIGGQPMPTTVFGATGALELTVHAWDLAATTGGGVIPDPLAGELLAVVPHLVPMADRYPLFAPPLPEAGRSYAERLLAYLGRNATLPAPGSPGVPITRRERYQC